MPSARSLAAMLFLALTFSFGAPATAAFAQAQPGGCGTPANPANPADPANPNPGQGRADPATPADPADPADPQRCPPRRADTGFGGSAGTGSETTILLVGGGVLALGAAFGVRRARSAKA